MDKLSFSELQGVLLVLERGREIWVKLAKWLSSSNVCLHNLAVLFLMWKLNPNWFPDASTHSEWLGFWHCDFRMFKFYLGCIWICNDKEVLHKKVVCRTQHRPHRRECLLAVFHFFYNAGAIAATFVCPLDVVKTRLQVHRMPVKATIGAKGNLLVLWQNCGIWSSVFILVEFVERNCWLSIQINSEVTDNVKREPQYDHAVVVQSQAHIGMQ